MNDADQRSERVLVIGWGFIGAALGHRLLANGQRVVALTRRATERTDAARAAGIDLVIGDATDRAVLDHAMVGVTRVVYAAGGLLPPAAAAAPVEDAITTLAPLIVTLETIAARPDVALTYVSSGGTVYGNPAAIPVSENHPVLPVSPYGASRLAGEIYTDMYARSFGIATRVVRCANVYGPDQASDRGQGAVAVFLDRVAAGLPVVIAGDGSAVRDYVYIDDVADALARLAVLRSGPRTVNVGSGQGHSVIDLVERVSTVVGRPPVLEFHPARRHDVSAIVLDVSQLRALMPYSPLDLAEGLRRTWSARELREAHASAPGVPRSR